MKLPELTAHLINALAQQYDQDPTLQKFDIETRYAFARATILAAMPDICDLGICADGSHALLITPTATSNILNCAIGRDFNAENYHTGVNGTAQTGTLVNGVYAVAIACLIGGRLVGINPFYWLAELPIGVPAIITLQLPDNGRSKAKVTMEGFRADTGEPLSRETEVLLVDIPK